MTFPRLRQPSSIQSPYGTVEDGFAYFDWSRLVKFELVKGDSLDVITGDVPASLETPAGVMWRFARCDGLLRTHGCDP